MFYPYNMKDLESPIHENNVYAFNSGRQAMHISEVESGKKGYICMGCGFEMIAKKGQIHQHHFAHAPRTFEEKKTCSFSDETHRHKLAKETLQRIRRIKVPATYVFSEDKSNALKIQEARTIVASSVKNEVQFYEDEEGNIQYGRGISFSDSIDKELLIQPDVTFFDATGNPILLIELVATHKVTPEKLVKIQRLGIDTVEVNIPKSSPRDIEKVFSVTGKTQWIYNYEREDKQGKVSVSSSISSGVPPDAEHQKSILTTAETYRCRKAHLKDLIRGFNKCLGSEQFRSAQHRVNSKLSDVKRQTKELDDQVERHREECLRKLQRENEEQLQELGERREKTRAATRKGEDLFTSLERRYSKKDQYLRDKERELRTIQAEYRSGDSSRVEELREELRRLGGNTQSSRSLESDFEREKKRRDDSIGRARAELKRIEKEQVDYSEGKAEYRRKAEATAAATIRRREEETERAVSELEQKFEDKHRAIFEGIQNETFEGVPRARPGQPKPSEYRQLLMDITESREELNRFRELKRIFESGTWKK